MKNLSLILNIVLLLAVGALYILYFGHEHEAVAAQAEEAAEQAGLNVVYIHSDSLLTNFTSVRVKMEDLSKRQTNADANLKKKMRALEKDFLDVQQKVQQGLLTPKQIAQEEQRFTQKQQELMSEQEQLSNQFSREMQELQIELETKVREKLDLLQLQYNYDYVLSYGPGTDVLLVNDSLDITPKLLELLNE